MDKQKQRLGITATGAFRMNCTVETSEDLGAAIQYTMEQFVKSMAEKGIEVIPQVITTHQLN